MTSQYGASSSIRYALRPVCSQPISVDPPFANIILELFDIHAPSIINLPKFRSANFHRMDSYPGPPFATLFQEFKADRAKLRLTPMATIPFPLDWELL